VATATRVTPSGGTAGSQRPNQDTQADNVRPQGKARVRLALFADYVSITIWKLGSECSSSSRSQRIDSGTPLRPLFPIVSPRHCFAVHFQSFCTHPPITRPMGPPKTIAPILAIITPPRVPSDRAALQMK